MSDDILRALPARLREQNFCLEKEKRDLEPGYDARAAAISAAQATLCALERAISSAITDVEGETQPPDWKEMNGRWRDLQLNQWPRKCA